MGVNYEWDVETTDEFGDVIDHDHDEILAKLLERHRTLDKGQSIVLVRTCDLYSHTPGERSWAYVGPEGLPKRFDNGVQVPNKFVWEFNRSKREAR